MTQKTLGALQRFLELKTQMTHGSVRKKTWPVLSIPEEAVLIWAAGEPGFSEKTEGNNPSKCESFTRSESGSSGTAALCIHRALPCPPELCPRSLACAFFPPKKQIILIALARSFCKTQVMERIKEASLSPAGAAPWFAPRLCSPREISPEL